MKMSYVRKLIFALSILIVMLSFSACKESEKFNISYTAIADMQFPFFTQSDGAVSAQATFAVGIYCVNAGI